MSEILALLSDKIVHIVHVFGYFGIVLGMAIESTVLPLPSELIMIPSGYLAHQGKMSALLAVLCGTLGSVIGSLANYFFAKHLGRGFILIYGKYFFLSRRKISKMDRFFKKYGDFSILIGRLLFGVRHFISIPAGLSKMNIWRFTAFTAIGSAIWMAILVGVGYYIGATSSTIHEVMPALKIGFFVVCFACVVGYFFVVSRRNGA